ncbi:SRPBCC domain-containing protein, partial [bacterium M00.F.Ca.ET.222.01.1.1]
MTEHALPEVTHKDVYITRSFNAPVAVVWRFWTEPELLAQWFGPHGITI